MTFLRTVITLPENNLSPDTQAEHGDTGVLNTSTQDRFKNLQEQFDLVESWLDALGSSGALPPVEATAQLLRTLAEMAAAQDMPGLDETARSMASFMDGIRSEHIDARDYQQLLLMLDSLRKQLRSSEAAAESGRGGGAGSQAPGKTDDQAIGQADNHRIALYMETLAVAESLRSMLAQAGFVPSHLASMSALEQAGPDDFPAAIVADMGRCLADSATLSALQNLRARFAPPPPLFCLMDVDTPERRLQAARLGATHFIHRPIDPVFLVDSLDSATARGNLRPTRVLFIDDDATVTKLYLVAMAAVGVDARACNDATGALAEAVAFMPDVIVTDLYMPGCNGLELAGLLRQDPAFADTPLLFLSSETDLPRQMAALEVGGDDFLTKPVRMQVLQGAVIARARRARRLQQNRTGYAPKITVFAWSRRG